MLERESQAVLCCHNHCRASVTKNDMRTEILMCAAPACQMLAESDRSSPGHARTSALECITGTIQYR